MGQRHWPLHGGRRRAEALWGFVAWQNKGRVIQLLSGQVLTTVLFFVGQLYLLSLIRAGLAVPVSRGSEQAIHCPFRVKKCAYWNKGQPGKRVRVSSLQNRPLQCDPKSRLVSNDGIGDRVVMRDSTLELFTSCGWHEPVNCISKKRCN